MGDDTTTDVHPAELRHRLDRLETDVDKLETGVDERLKSDVVDAKQYKSDLDGIRWRLDALDRDLVKLEQAMQDAGRSQVTMYRSILLVFLAVLIEAAVIALKVG